MYTESDIRLLVAECSQYLSEIPALHNELPRFTELTAHSMIHLVPAHIPPEHALHIPLTKYPGAAVSVRSMSQLVDIRPFENESTYVTPVPIIVLRQDITTSGLFHEICHLLSTGIYHRTEDGYLHKRGCIHEDFLFNNHRLVCARTVGKICDNEALTDMCAEFLLSHIYPKETYIRNRRYESFLSQHPNSDMSESITHYFIDAYAT